MSMRERYQCRTAGQAARGVRIRRFTPKREPFVAAAYHRRRRARSPLLSSIVSGDHELLHLWSEGDVDAGNALFQRHFESIFHFFHNRAAAEAEELTQATFLGAVEARERFRADASFRTFLFAIARRQLLKHFERSRRHAVVTFRSHSLVDLGTSLATRVAAARDEVRLRDAMSRLPVDLQLALELHYWEGLSTAEVGEVLECPQGTVKRWLWRARKLLADELGIDESALVLEERS
jgi:RNA polymerase sigma-70 factor (ECF subfamily)